MGDESAKSDTVFVEHGLDGGKNAGQIWGCYENALTQSFEKSPHLMGLANYPHIPFMASLWIRSGLSWP